jgi:hypothetical protein
LGVKLVGQHKVKLIAGPLLSSTLEFV